MNSFENTTNLRQLPLIIDSSLIAFSLSASTKLPMLLHQVRILCGKSLLSRLNKYRNKEIVEEELTTEQILCCYLTVKYVTLLDYADSNIIQILKRAIIKLR